VKRTPVIKDRQVALYAGIAALCLGSWLLYDAYEARGRQRPFAARFLPGA
jgi:hypothetical protein